MDKFVVVGREDCPWCSEAKNLLSKTPFEYEYIDITNRQNPIRLLLKAQGLTTVPQVWLGSNLIGGYSDLKEYLLDHHNDQLDLFEHFGLHKP